MWSDPIPLREYLRAPCRPGIYVIVGGRNGQYPVGDVSETDWRLGRNWPNNADPLYVGKSDSIRFGIVSRLRSHYRLTGNKGVGHNIALNIPLWYIFAVLDPSAEKGRLQLALLEALLLETMNFPLNVRGERKRAAAALNRLVDQDLARQGRLPIYYDPQDG